jgi:succinoglycan biosynthesis transport protein ExoP
MHDAYLQKFNEAIQKVSFPEPDVRLIAPAMAPLSKSYPRRGLIVALGVLIGLGLGVIAAAVRQSLDRSLRLPAQLGPEGPCFGAVSEFPTNHRLSPRAARKEARAEGSGRHLATYGTNPAMRLVAENPSSRAAAEFRDIQVSLECAVEARGTRLVGVVAATQGEGATTIAANLAAVYASEGLRAGVIDLRRDGMQTAGQVLKWARAESSRAQSSSADHSNVSALGTVHVNGNLASVATLGERLQPAAEPENVGHYQAIVFDFPGLRTSGDARAMARFLDAMIVVAQAGVTPVDAVHAAVRALRSAGAPVVGVVLNKAGSG